MDCKWFRKNNMREKKGMREKGNANAASSKQGASQN